MNQLLIQGNKKLNGTIRVQGAKNYALKVIAASTIVDGDLELSNVPEIEDIFRMLEILEDLGGAWVHKKGHVYSINTRRIKKTELSKIITPKLRAAVVFIGPMLARFKKVTLPHPGGCAIGRRPINLFIEGMRAFGASVKYKSESYVFEAKKLKATTFIFPSISVTGTETLLLLATLVKGKSILKNCALEPEIVALANFLNRCGARIRGAGTSTIIINGVKKLKAKKEKIIPDRIDAGSFIILAAATKSHLKILNCCPEHLLVPLKIFQEMGIKLKIGQDFIEVFKTKNIKPYNISTHEYPGFPTDLQPPMVVLLTQTKGRSIVRETIHEGRFFYTDMLNRMGTQITMCDPSKIIVSGPSKMHGKKVESPDLRAGIAMIVAALIAKGKTVIDNAYQINRGYENIVERLVKIGVDVRKK